MLDTGPIQIKTISTSNATNISDHLSGDSNKVTVEVPEVVSAEVISKSTCRNNCYESFNNCFYLPYRRKSFDINKLKNVNTKKDTVYMNKRMKLLRKVEKKKETPILTKEPFCSRDK
jgi:hypothetical protein